MAMEVRVEHADSSTDTLTHLSSKEEYEFGKQDQASVFVPRSEVNNITLTEAEDEIFIVEDGADRFGGLLKDIVRGGSEIELVVGSFEQYARDAEPTAPDDVYNNVADTTAINDAIGDISQLTAGTVNNQKSGLSFIFSHSSQAHKIRKVEEVTPGEVRYNADKTVDYVSSLGADKTATTLSPGSQKIVGDIEVLRNSGDERVTHLKAIGAGEGDHQRIATATASNYSAGDRKIWRTYSNKGITDTATLQSLADTLIAELNTDFIEVDAVIKDEDIDLGDDYHVTYSDEGIDDDLRVVELTTIIDSKGKRHSAVLSSRQKSRQEPTSKNKQDLERYNLAVQGVAVPINAGGGRQPVDSAHNYVMKLYYPSEVEYEHRLNVRVMGLNYRAYSQGAAAGGDHTHTVDVTHPSHTHDVTHPSHTHDVTHPSHSHDVTHPSHTHDVTHPSHDHSVDIGTTQANNPHGAVAASGQNTHAIGDTGGSWSQVETISESGYEVGFVGFATSGADAVIEVRVRDSSSGGPSDTGITTYPDDAGDTGIFLTGTENPRSGTDTEDISEAQVGSGLIPVPEDLGFLDIDYKTTFDPLCNLYIWWILLDEHTHDTTGTTSSTALGTTETSTTALGTTETSTTALGTTETSTTALGTTETSTTALGTTQSETSDASGDHTHSVDPGIIDTTDYPSNCDVLVNGVSQSTSFGDGTGEFTEVVDISGALNEGQVNTIEVTSDTLGHIQAFIEGDVYRQILGRG